jgi:uncharacterized surface protein with fasciclin (FAS1) repeats
MKNGNTTLYIIIGVVALAVIGFLVYRNNKTDTQKSDEAVTVTDESTTDETGMTDESNMESTDSMVMADGQEDEMVAMVGDPSQDISVNLANSADHTSFMAAVQAAGLTNTLKSTGPYTVFAPRNAAIEKLPSGTLDELLKPENKADLTSVVSYHVVAGDYPSDKLTDGMELKTLNGTVIKVTTKNGEWYINDVTKIQTKDVEAKNGTIYVTDTVLLP